jgi:hypothetical protein
LDYLFAPDADTGDVEDLLEWDDQVGVEDVELVERVQAGLNGAKVAGIGAQQVNLMPESEQLVTWFANQLRRTF